jgi:hypothetical protein
MSERLKRPNVTTQFNFIIESMIGACVWNKPIIELANINGITKLDFELRGYRAIQNRQSKIVIKLSFLSRSLADKSAVDKEQSNRLPMPLW